VIHYRSSLETNKVLTDKALFLLDSGAHYNQGTTDITRVFHFGNPSPEEKFYYTLVLKGHLALSSVIFPQGTMGEYIDAFARQYLWQQGLDYPHGTGHGVGCFLCVHEGPQSIARRTSGAPLSLNMVVSNEPGVYFAGKYGIRIENLCRVKLHNCSPMGEFYTFEELTLVPYERKLIDKTLLTAQEIEKINGYHQRIITTLGSHLSTEVNVFLAQACSPL
jgi:Xaa-Pro aminopeptidase